MNSMSDMLPYFHNLGAWNWLILGGVLIGLEILVSGVFLIWFGISALIVGSIALGSGISWQLQLVLFAVLSLLAVIVSKKYLHKNEEDSDNPLLNQRAAKNIGHSFALTDPIVNGRGTVKIADSIWRVEGQDCPLGAMVTVIGADGNVLQVEPA